MFLYFYLFPPFGLFGPMIFCIKVGTSLFFLTLIPRAAELAQNKKVHLHHCVARATCYFSFYMYILHAKPNVCMHFYECTIACTCQKFVTFLCSQVP